jgi:hypothetical protein
MNPPIPIVIIACQVLQDQLTRLLPGDLASQVTYMDYGLHEVPRRMTTALQELLDGIQEPSLVVLGYGLCGNGLRGLRAGRHTLLVPRVADCISLLLGSHEAYAREFAGTPGTYYLSKGWLEAGSHPLKEYQEYVVRYGEEKAIWIMDQQYRHYERLVLVAHSQADLETYRPQAQEVARFCARWDMRYEELLGSDGYVQSLVEIVERARDGDGNPGHPIGTVMAHAQKEDFLIIPPGSEIRQEQFVR